MKIRNKKNLISRLKEVIAHSDKLARWAVEKRLCQAVNEYTSRYMAGFDICVIYECLTGKRYKTATKAQFIEFAKQWLEIVEKY